MTILFLVAFFRRFTLINNTQSTKQTLKKDLNNKVQIPN